MRASTAFIFMQLGAFASAQALSGLPVCAQNAAVIAATNTGCILTDASCLCRNAGFIASLKGVISGSCTGSDQQATCAWGNTACAVFGVTVDCSAYGSTTSASPTAASSTAATDSSTGVSATPAPGTTLIEASITGGEVTAAAASAISSMMSSMMSMTTSIMASNATMGNMTFAATSRTASAPTSQYTGAANTAAKHCGVVGVLAGVAFLLAVC